MDIEDVLPPGGIQALAAQLGVPEAEARQGAEALIPSLLAGFGDKAGGPSAPHAAQLDQRVQSLGGADLADNVIGTQPTDTARGDQLLGDLFGSKDVSRQVAGHAAQGSGLDPALLKKMLPILAMLVAGYMSKRAGGQAGGLGGVLGSVLGGMSGASAGGQAGGGLGGALGSILSGAGGAAGGGGLGGMFGSILGGRR